MDSLQHGQIAAIRGGNSSTLPRLDAMNPQRLASDAVEQIRFDMEHAGWMAALMTAISTDAKHNHGLNVEQLAGLGFYLASDLHGHLDLRAEELEEQLDAAIHSGKE